MKDNILKFLKSVDTKNAKNWLEDFYKLNINSYQYLLKNKTEKFWEYEGQKKALKIFKQAALRVPAYKDFLKKRKIYSEKIKTIIDFALVPTTDKHNYIETYPLALRCWDGKLPKQKLIAMSSGTTGKANYWPRGNYTETEAALTHELLYKDLFEIHRHNTLLIIGFPMGVYVSGVATLLPSWLVAQKYPNLTILATGNNKTEVLNAIKNTAEQFEQIILVGHPFFLKDILETGNKEGIKWSKIQVNMMFCSEGFTEQWREYVCKTTGLNQAKAINTYGSSEFLLMAYETQSSIDTKKILETKPNLAKSLLGTSFLFNLFQYNPLLRYIEEQQKELLFTSNSGVPLIRFNLHDSGKIISHNELKQTLPQIKKPSWQLPYLALFGRSDQTMIFYAANIYPQHIHQALNNKNFLKKITGKFTMFKGYKKNKDAFLKINIELQPKVKPNLSLAKQIAIQITEKLKQVNMEYLFLWNNLNKDIRPIVKLWPYQHEEYFKPGLKPRYIFSN